MAVKYAAPNYEHNPASGLGNVLLDATDPVELQALLPLLQRRYVERDEMIAQTGGESAEIYFPIDAVMAGSTSLPAGRRGCVGISGYLGGTMDAVRASAVIPGWTWSLPIEALTYHTSAYGTLRTALQRYAGACITVLSLRFDCYTRHNVDRRVARWLAFLQDETGCSTLDLSHRHLADIASIRRPCVSTAMSALQRRGIVRCGHGEIEILDRPRLDTASCECFSSVSAALDAANGKNHAYVGPTIGTNVDVEIVAKRPDQKQSASALA